MAEPEEVKTEKKEKEEAPPLLDVHFDVARTSRAKCGGCSAAMEAGEERIAKEVNSQHGKVIKSYHPQCAISISFNEDNRSKCSTCKEALTLGDYRVKIGCATKSGPGTKHHYNCLFDGTGEGVTNNHTKLQDILAAKKALVNEEDRPAAGPKKKKPKKE